MNPFLDRTRELSRLDAYWLSGRAELLIVTGRRRVGKSRLLEQFFANRLAIHTVGTAQTTANQLADITRELHRVTGDPLLAAQTLSSWDAVLAYAGSLARDRRVALILDEFSYYVDQSPELPSVLQRWWDQTGQHSQILLVLASSHLGFLDRLLAGDQPLFGRRTGELRLRPFDYQDAALFFPGYSAIDRIRAYGVFGGMPAYLAACDPAIPLTENIVQRVLFDDAFLRREPLYLLAQERSISQPAVYVSVLRAIAEGKTTPNEIAQAAGLRAAADVAPILDRLREIDLVERSVPITAEPSSRISRYYVSDPFLAFWFRFVQPNESLLSRGLADRVLAQIVGAVRPGTLTPTLSPAGEREQDAPIQPSAFSLPPSDALDRFLSRAAGPWETACRDFLWRSLAGQSLGDVRFDLLGPWWEHRAADDSSEIDLVGLDGKRVALVGSCKWRNDLMKLGDLFELDRAAARLGADDQTVRYLFSRSGFDPALQALTDERLRLITPEVMFSPTTDDGPTIIR